jgi:hypothetical protein
MSHPEPSSTSGTPADRRRYRRVQVRGLLRGQVVTMATAMDVQDLSLGGFSAETAMPFFQGRLYEFEFTPPAGAPVVLSAHVAYCRRISEVDAAPRYHSGFQFTPLAQSQASVDALIAQVAPTFRTS